MIGTTKMVLIAAGLLLVGSAVASPGTLNPAADHANAKARDHASVHSALHGKSLEAAVADLRCDEFRNHGAYVSSVAQNASHDDNESDDEDERENKTHDHNRTAQRDHERHERRNETREDNETAPRDDDRTNPVREAAHSDIGKCGGSAKDDDSKPEHGAEDSDEADDDADEDADASHGRSDEARSEHPPRNDK